MHEERTQQQYKTLQNTITITNYITDKLHGGGSEERKNEERTT